MSFKFLTVCAVSLMAISVQAAEVQPIKTDTNLDITAEQLQDMNYLDQLKYLDQHDPGLTPEQKKNVQMGIELLSKRNVQLPKTSVNEKGETIPAYQDPNLMYELFKPADSDDEVLDKVDFEAMAKEAKKAAVEPKKADDTMYQINVDQF